MAADHGLQLTNLTGSGPGGRITKRDIEAQMSRPRTPVPIGADRGFETVRISQMRKAIARRLAESKYTSPHFYLNVDVDVTALIAHRTAVNEYLEKSGRPKVSFNDFVTKASAIALVQHPDVNVTYVADEGSDSQVQLRRCGSGRSHRRWIGHARCAGCSSKERGSYS